MKKIALFVLLSVGMLGFVHPTAFTSYISFKGTKQGQIKGSATQKGREKDGWFNVTGFKMGGETPIDAAKPTSQNKRPHPPISITREVDAATPLLYQAMSTNEVFELVTIQTVDESNKPTKTVNLSNALLTAMHKDGTRETLTFTFDKLVTN